MSTHTILRPTANLEQGNALLVSGAANALAAISDNSDSSYVESTGPGTEWYWGLATITLTAAQRVVGIKIFSRDARETANVGAQDVGWWMSLWPNTSPHTTEWRRSRSKTSILTGSSASYATPPGRTTEWTQDLINKIGLRAKWYLSANGIAVFQRVYDAWIDVEIISQAVVTGAPSVTNFTNNATPTVAWGFNDPDGGTEQAYEVKIFDAATIAGGGFSADTSTPTWQTGQVIAASTSVDVTTPLQNGVTYTAYVRVAKMGPSLPNASPYWWSPWATSAPFTVTFTSPYVPTITTAAVVADDSLYRAVLDIFVPVNLLTLNNASLENTIGQWAALTNCTVVRDTAQHADGVASLKMTSTAAGVMSARCALISNRPQVEQGQTYTALASFKTAVTARSCQVGINWLDASQAIISTQFGTGANDNTSTFTQVSFSGTPPAGALYARVVVQVSTPAAGAEVHWVDKVSIHAGTSTTWMPGGYTNDQSGLILERGEFLGDQRGPALNWFEEQVGSTGSVARNGGEGFSYNSAQSVLTWQWLDRALGRPGYVASGTLSWLILSGASNELLFGSDFFGQVGAHAPPAIVGQAHTFSVWAWVDSTTRSVKAGIKFLSQTGAVLQSTVGAAVTLTTTPQRIQFTATAPAGTYYASGFVQDQGSANSQHMFFSTAGFGLGTASVDQYQPMGLDGSPIWRRVQFIADDNTLESIGDPIGFGQTETLPDFEYPAARPVFYRAWITYTFSNAGIDTLIRSDYSPYAVVYGTAPNRTVLRSVTNNRLGCVVNRRKTLSTSFAEDAEVYHPLGADAAPLKVRDWYGGEDNQLELVVSTDVQWQRLRALLTSNDVLELQWGNGGRTYALINTVAVSETYTEDSTVCDVDGYVGPTRYTIITLSYIETVSPSTLVV